MRRLTAEVEALRAAMQHTAVRAARGDRSASQLRLLLELNEQQRERLAALPELLDERQIQAHVSRVIAAIPPAVFFDDRDRLKQDLPLPLDCGPAFPRAA